MSVLDPRKTYQNLKGKGFKDSSSKSVDHKYLSFFHNDVEILYTKISHGSHAEINDYLIGQMHKQCKLNKKDFIDLAKCILSQEEYIKKLVESGFIDSEETIEYQSKNKEIHKYFTLKNKDRIIGFLDTNNNLMDVLIDCYNQIYSQVIPSSLVLELVTSTSDGSTLNINIFSDLNCDVESIQELLNKYIADNYPCESSKLSFILK